jgi:hypothetical protein
VHLWFRFSILQIATLPSPHELCKPIWSGHYLGHLANSTFSF